MRLGLLRTSLPMAGQHDLVRLDVVEESDAEVESGLTAWPREEDEE